jgi:hypothetical protein
MTWVVTKISIQGIKGVLDRAGDFSLKYSKGKPKSLVIFGRNAHGKSGYADAIEYLFSFDGEVAHLGKGSADSEQGGKYALPHVLAEEKGITPQVNIEFTDLESKEVVAVSRRVNTGRKDPRPKELGPILEKSPAYRVLRQHDLRRFVVDMTPGEKFSEFARWIGLESTANLLKYLKTAENALRDENVDREIAERLMSIETHTGGVIKSFDKSAILVWCREAVSAKLQQPFDILEPEDINSALAALQIKRETLLVQSRMVKQGVAKTGIDKVMAELIIENGSLTGIRDSLEQACRLEEEKNVIESSSKESVFKEVWEQSSIFLSSGTYDYCPVCQTEWTHTKVGSQEKAQIVLQISLAALANLIEKNEKLNKGIVALKSQLQKLKDGLEQIEGIFRSLSLDQTAEQVNQLETRIVCLIQSLTSPQKIRFDLECVIEDGEHFISTEIPKALELINSDSNDNATGELDALISNLQVIKESLERLGELTRIQASLNAVSKSFSKIANKIREETKKVADNAVDALRSDVTTIYKKIHPAESVPNVHIIHNVDDKTLTIRVNFHSNERIVPPGGYLSEAQINTLGLALFLSSVRLFNNDFPFVFLDDIVSSYDAEHRANIVDVLAEDMKSFQILLTTHDERFYTHLKGRLIAENWAFERILSYDFNHGPRRESDNFQPDHIKVLIEQGDEKVAGNAVRQYMEEWFDSTCERYSVYTLHRKGTKEYKRTLFDFWPPFTKKLEALNGEFAKKLQSSQSYTRLKGGLDPIINYYSHNQTNPYEWASMGDVEYIWNAFYSFSLLFFCASCGKQVKYHSEDAKFYCTCGESIVCKQQLADVQM